MHTKTIIISVISALVIVPVVYHKGHQNAIVERFPDLDPKSVKKHYNEIMKDIVRGKIQPLDDEDAMMAQMDAEIIRRVTSQ